VTESFRGLSRRGFLLGVPACALSFSALAASSKDASVKSSVTAGHEYLSLSAVDAVARMRSGDLSAERYAQALLTRCAAGHALNAFITLDSDRVLEHARAADRLRQSGARLGPLHGLPIPVKDSINTREYPTTGGTPALRNFRPQEDAPIVRRLVDAGAIVLGKTNLHELSFGWTSNNLAYGAVHNPYDPTRIPGGSSGGTGAAIAARMAPLGVAEDTEGSIRVPAALCGVAGFRPTTRRYSTEGAVPISARFDQVGPHARSVADLVLFDQVAAGDAAPVAEQSLRGVRLAVGRRYWFEGLDPEVERLTEAAFARLRDAGVEFVEAEVPDIAELVGLITAQVQQHDVRFDLPRYLERYGVKLSFDEVVTAASADIRAVFARDVLPGGSGFVTEEVYRAAVDVHLPRLQENYRRYFADTRAAAIVFPPSRVPAPRIGAVDVEIRGVKVPVDEAVARNISAGSTAGLPGLVLPIGLAASGLPVALEFDGPAGGDRTLLALGLALEKALGKIPGPPV